MKEEDKKSGFLKKVAQFITNKSFFTKLFFVMHNVNLINLLF